MNKIIEILTKLRVKELLGRPTFGSLLVKMDLEENNTWCDTFSTNGIHWYFNQDFIKTHKADMVMGMMYHSMLHLALGNLLPPEGYDKDIWDIASDIECYATASQLSLGSTHSKILNEVSIYNDKNATEIYDDLLRLSPSEVERLKNVVRIDTHLEISENNYDPLDLARTVEQAGEGEDSGSGEGDNDNSDSQENNGDKGEGEDSSGEGEGGDGEESSEGDAEGNSEEGEGGEPSDGSSSSSESTESDSQGGDPSGESGDQGDSDSSNESNSKEDSNSDSSDSSSDSSESSSSPPKLDGSENKEVTLDKDQLPKDIEPKLIDSDLAKTMQEFKTQLMTMGNHAEDKMPGNMIRLFKEMTEPKLEWRDILTNTMSTIFDKSDYSFAKPSKRSYCLGKMDYILPSMGNGETIDICVSLDTSGSITDEIFADFVTEVRSIVENYDDFRLHIWCIDTEIYNPQVFTPENVKDLDSYEFAGGGGNDFPLNWEYMEKNDIIPELFVVFSDGYPCGSWGWPDYCDTIFVVRNEYELIDAPFGTTVQMIPQNKDFNPYS